jgi:hypothetical protein
MRAQRFPARGVATLFTAARRPPIEIEIDTHRRARDRRSLAANAFVPLESVGRERPVTERTRWMSMRRAIARRRLGLPSARRPPEHDPEKACPGLDPGRGTGFRKRSCSNNKPERDDDSIERSSRSGQGHHAPGKATSPAIDATP